MISAIDDDASVSYIDADMRAQDPALEFRLFVAKWLETAGWSQYQLALAAGIGQSIISRWMNPTLSRRTVPTPDTLRKLSDVVGRPYDELMHMAGYNDAVGSSSTSDDPPELAALIADVRAGWHETDAPQRQTAADVTRAAFHVRKSRRSRSPSVNDSLSDARLDKPKRDSRTHTNHASLASVRSIRA